MIPTPLHDYTSPFQKLTHQFPSYLDFKTFGCACYPYLRPYNQYKIQLRSKQQVVLGYSSSHKGYLCLAPAGKVYVSRHVKFDEHTFPFHDNHFLHSSVKTSTLSHSSHHLYLLCLLLLLYLALTDMVSCNM